jgi:CubicO group peptidase (beta-lactamase class C family)
MKYTLAIRKLWFNGPPMNIATILLLSVVTFAQAGVCFAQGATASPPRPPLSPERLKFIDSFIETEMTGEEIPGLAVGIYSRGQILLAKGYGQANLELGVPVKPETIFQSGSLGKQFAAAAIMILVEEGKVSLDDSITKYFPNAPADWKPILVENLLSHTSGLAEYGSRDRTGPKGPFYLRLDFTEDELATKIEALPVEGPPGVRWDYRNTNYVLLGIIIHKVTDKPFYEFFSERIFQPLGMTSTRIISERDIIPNRAAGYRVDDGELKNQGWVSPTFNATADGALYFNVLDLAKWDNSLYGTQLLKQSSLDRMWTPYLLSDGKPNAAGYGFGWHAGKQNDHKRLEHTGGWQGFSTAIARYPDDNLTVVILTNSRDADPGYMAEITAALAEPLLLPRKLTPILDTQPSVLMSLVKTLDRLTGRDDSTSQTPDGTGVRFIPDSKWLRRRLANLWPGGTLALLKRIPPADPTDASTSMFRLSKGRATAMLYIESRSDGTISSLRTADREYDW